MSVNQQPGRFQPIRHDRLLQEQEHDAYKSRGKLPEPSVCPQCGAIFHQGRWQWGKTPDGAHSAMCPACHRIHDHFPAGFVTLKGNFIWEHRDEVMNLVHNQEKRERLEHPLKRIMDIQEKADEILITTTDIHLARSIGDALHHAYKGSLAYHYNQAQNLLRVEWVH